MAPTSLKATSDLWWKDSLICGLRQVSRTGSIGLVMLQVTDRLKILEPVLTGATRELLRRACSAYAAAVQTSRMLWPDARRGLRGLGQKRKRVEVCGTVGIFGRCFCCG